jgi:hypothetical protein
MRISIPEAARPLVEKQMAKAGYEDAGEYLMSLIERERHRALRKEVEEMLLEAIKEPSTPLTKELLNQIRREGRRVIAQRKTREQTRRH